MWLSTYLTYLARSGSRMVTISSWRTSSRASCSSEFKTSPVDARIPVNTSICRHIYGRKNRRRFGIPARLRQRYQPLAMRKMHVRILLKSVIPLVRICIGNALIVRENFEKKLGWEYRESSRVFTRRQFLWGWGSCFRRYLGSLGMLGLGRSWSFLHDIRNNTVTCEERRIQQCFTLVFQAQT